MEFYKGIAALSEFNKSKLLTRLQIADPGVTDVSAEYIHFVDVDGKLSPANKATLKKLLTYGSPFDGQQIDEPVLVTPRLGTISSWSSKATDIAKNAGMTNVKRIERGTAYYINGKFRQAAITSILHDPMIEAILPSIESAAKLFEEPKPKDLQTIDVLGGGKAALQSANKTIGLALSDDEIDYLLKAYKNLGRNPTDVELMMFAQVNSEHCRHKIFNADWVIDGQKQPKSLFKMIRNTYEKNSKGVLSAYSDNAAVISGSSGGRFFADADGAYRYHKEPVHFVIKAETHNHPTAIAPSPGAATGAGGEIRDEGATGRGAKPKMGLAGYSVSNLNLPELPQPWEKPYGTPSRIASALDIMLEAPIGAAGYVNEFGRPNLTGYFRTYQQEHNGDVWGYHKPIMIAGGLGNIRESMVQKNELPHGAKIIVLGGPAMLIGLGGGAASSMQTGTSHEDLDFASVQRANAEMERRVQEVIDRCWELDDKNPIISIHDVGAGGLSNALPELVHDCGRGARFELRDLPSAETGLSPLEIWCNESQERYVLGIAPEDLERFSQLAQRERCPFAVVGEATQDQQLIVTDKLFGNTPIDLPMETLFGKPPKMTRTVTSRRQKSDDMALDSIKLDEAIKRVLHLPAVGSKKFLITIGDRTVGGLVARDQMIGPWQVPVSDAAVTAAAFDTNSGEAMAMGERTPLAVTNAAASARMAVGEAITNIVSADIARLSDIKLSANWMAAAGYKNEDQALYEAVQAVGEEFCPALGLTIPVGKDSLSMRTNWDDKSVTAPLSLVISAFSAVANVQKTLIPLLDTTQETSLILIDLGIGKARLGGSALAQVYSQAGHNVPDADPKLLNKFFTTLRQLKSANKMLAYHDRSDGGLLAALCEMAFASRCGLDITLDSTHGNALEQLFSEELGAVIQVRSDDEQVVLKKLQSALGTECRIVTRPKSAQQITVDLDGTQIYQNSRAQLEKWWSDTSYHIQKLRDNSACADQEYQAIGDDANPGLSPKVTFKPSKKRHSNRPKVAIFREQGVNGHIEMAAAFDKAGFTSIDVHLSDIASGRKNLNDFVGLAACGGFSYGDVLGAGEGWAKTILSDTKLRRQFQLFFERPDTFSVGICNGCQMLAALKEIIPGAEAWPEFLKNQSEQFEARVVLTKINKSPSIFFKDMEDSVLPVPVAHGEGRAHFTKAAQAKQVLTAMSYVDNRQQPTESYPSNPNGSPKGATAFTTPDGRATIMMPHPERTFQSRQLSWHPAEWDADSPWLQMFRNARDWVRD